MSFILLFILTAILFTIAGKYMTKLIKYISLGTINRLLGGIFSSLKFLIIIVSISMVINYFSELLAIEIIPSDQKNKSTVYPILISIANLICSMFNYNYILQCTIVHIWRSQRLTELSTSFSAIELLMRCPATISYTERMRGYMSAKAVAFSCR